MSYLTRSRILACALILTAAYGIVFAIAFAKHADSLLEALIVFGVSTVLLLACAAVWPAVKELRSLHNSSL